ncbi:hypothetical protein M0Q50_02160 [bacterium]|jgi:hypothetical protein|nr:hypothetical protein [bacterium]
MDIKEIVERGVCGDPRVFYAIQEAKRTDKSFMEKENVFTIFTGGIKYSQDECREFWFHAMTLGMQEGLRMGSIQGQRIDLTNNCKDPKQMEFLVKLFGLCEEYNCAIVFHPNEGMIVTDLNK